LRQILLTLADPIVNRIPRRRGKKLPIACVFAVDDQLSRATIAQGKSRCVGIDACTAAIANRQPNAAITRHVDPIRPLFFSSQSGLGCIDFEVFVFAIKLREANCDCSFNDTDRDSFIAQSDDAQG
jgi:hypothetical protein